MPPLLCLPDARVRLHRSPLGSALPGFEGTSGHCSARASEVQGSRLRLRDLHERLESRREYQGFDPEAEEYDYPEELPACKGVRAGSIQPCGLWTARYEIWG